jgi:hypothetical protein
MTNVRTYNYDGKITLHLFLDSSLGKAEEEQSLVLPMPHLTRQSPGLGSVSRRMLPLDESRPVCYSLTYVYRSATSFHSIVLFVCILSATILVFPG